MVLLLLEFFLILIFIHPLAFTFSCSFKLADSAGVSLVRFVRAGWEVGRKSTDPDPSWQVVTLQTKPESLRNLTVKSSHINTPQLGIEPRALS